MKSLIAILLATLSLNALSQTPDYVPTEGLAGWWPLDGNALDGGSFENHGTVSGAVATTNRYNEASGAMIFDGIDDHIVVPDAASLQITGNLTISLWYKTAGPTGNYQTFLTKRSGGQWPYSFGLSHYYGSGGCPGELDKYITGRRNNGSEYDLRVTEKTYVSDEWTHAAMTIENDVVTFYENGMQVGSTCFGDEFFVSPIDQGAPLTFGTCNCGLSEMMTGSLDDIGIWSRALAPDEILAVAQPHPGCLNEAACNFNSEANFDDGSCVYSGCNDASACNFNGADLCDIDCIYPAIGDDCAAGEGLCGPGTYWDDASQTCQVTIPGDVDFNGCLSVEDLLGSLAIYNLCFDAEEIAFTCGVDVVNYDGYDYQTVQIGDQCWFAENLRSTHYSDGSDIPLLLSTEEWESQSGPALTFRGDSAQTVLWGAYYNWESLAQEYSVCPSGWHVPSHLEWSALEIAVGMDEEAAVNFGYRGGIPDVPIALSTTGTNSSGFSAVGAGFRYEHGGWDPNYTAFWTTTEVTNPLNAVSRKLFYLQNITAVPDLKTWGLSVRCLRDEE